MSANRNAVRLIVDDGRGAHLGTVTVTRRAYRVETAHGEVTATDLPGKALDTLLPP